MKFAYGSGACTRVSENRCECSKLKNLCCDKHEKRNLREVGRYADYAVRDSFTSHPSFSVLTKIIRSFDHHFRPAFYYKFLATDFKIREARSSRDGWIAVVCTEHGGICFFRSFVTGCVTPHPRTLFFTVFEICWLRRKYSKTVEIGNGPGRL
jgi:hypothetical protein